MPSHNADDADLDIVIFGDSYSPEYMGNGKTHDFLNVVFDAHQAMNPTGISGQILTGGSSAFADILPDLANLPEIEQAYVVQNFTPLITRNRQYHNWCRLQDTPWWYNSGPMNTYRDQTNGDILTNGLGGPPHEIPEGTFAYPEGFSGHRGYSQDGLMIERMETLFGVDKSKLNRYDFGIAGSTIVDYSGSFSCLSSWITPGVFQPNLTGGVGYNQLRFKDIGQNQDPKLVHRDYEPNWSFYTGTLVDPAAETRPPWIDSTTGLPMEAWRVIQAPPTHKVAVILHCGGNDVLFRTQFQHEQQLPGSIVTATNAPTIVVTTSVEHRLQSGDVIRLFNVIGNSAANGGMFIKRLSDTTFECYHDSALTHGIAGTGAGHGGNIARGDSVMAVPYTNVGVPPELWAATPTQAEAVKEYIDSVPQFDTPDPFDHNRWADNGWSGAFESMQKFMAQWIWLGNPQAEIIMPSLTNWSGDQPDVPRINTTHATKKIPPPTAPWMDASGTMQRPFFDELIPWTTSTTITVQFRNPGRAALYTGMVGQNVLIIFTSGGLGGTYMRWFQKNVVGVDTANNTLTFNVGMGSVNVPNPAWTCQVSFRDYTAWYSSDDGTEGFQGMVRDDGHCMPAMDAAYQPPFVNPDTIATTPFFPGSPTTTGEDPIFTINDNLPGWTREWMGIMKMFSFTYDTFGKVDYDYWALHYYADRDYRSPKGIYNIDPNLNQWTGSGFTCTLMHPLDHRKLWDIVYPADQTGNFIRVGGNLLPGALGSQPIPNSWGNYFGMMLQFKQPEVQYGFYPGVFVPYVLRFMMNGVVNRIIRQIVEPAQERNITYLRAHTPGTTPTSGKHRYHAPQIWTSMVNNPVDPLYGTPAADCKAETPWEPDGNALYASGSRRCFIDGLHRSKPGAQMAMDDMLYKWIPQSEVMQGLVTIPYIPLDVDDTWDMGAATEHVGVARTSAPSTRGERCNVVR